MPPKGKAAATKKEVDEIRASLQAGMAKVLKPFQKRIDAQRKVRTKDHIRV